MPFKLTMSTRLPNDNDGGTPRPMGFEQQQFYFHSRNRALEMAEANTSAIRTCEIRYVHDAPGPFEDEPRPQPA